jgi:uncharacterized protein (DUF427 family)
MKAIWNEKIIAESDRTVVVEGNHYFPPDSINREYLTDSDTTSVCPWKGTANYYNVVVDGRTAPDAAWCYATTKDAAASIEGRVAFWRGVNVTP